MDKYFGFKMPKAMHKEFADVIQKISEKLGEIAPQTIMDKFKEEYLEKEGKFKLINFKAAHLNEKDNADTKVDLILTYNDQRLELTGIGNGPINSLKNALSSLVDTTILDYSEHSLGNGSEANAAAYIHLKRNDNGKDTFGVGVSSNITLASVKAVFSALNRLYK